MPNLTIENIPDTLYQQIKQRAEINRHSINNEVIVCLERTIGCRTGNVGELIAESRRLRELTAHCPIDDFELNEAKRMGRP